MCWLQRIKSTQDVIHLLKKSHIIVPEKTNTGKYFSFELNTTPNTNEYMSIELVGSNTHHSQFKYEFATSALRSDFAAYTANPQYFFISRKNLILHNFLYVLTISIIFSISAPEL